MNKKLLLSALTIMTLAFAGCASTSTETGSDTVTGSPTVESSAVAESEALAQETGTVTVVHTLGETEVPKNPKNVVVMDYGILDTMDALEIEVAALPLTGSVPEYLSDYQNEEVYTNVGSLKEIDLEKVFEVEPELIIIGGRQSSYYEELSKIAPTVQLSVDASDYMNSFKTSVNYLGEIFGKEAEVATKLEAIETSMKEIAEKAVAKDVNGLVVLANGDAFSVYGQGSRFGIIHNEFGIKPVDENIEASTHGQNASFEYIVEQNPDYLFIVDRSAATATGGEGEGSAKAMFDNELIQGTDAYKNGRIIYLDPAVWYKAGGGFISTEVMLEEISSALDL